jgi:hypothetical protein
LSFRRQIATDPVHLVATHEATVLDRGIERVELDRLAALLQVLSKQVDVLTCPARGDRLAPAAVVLAVLVDGVLLPVLTGSLEQVRDLTRQKVREIELDLVGHD